MFFGDSRITFSLISWLNCGQCGANQYKKEQNHHGTVFNFHIN